MISAGYALDRGPTPAALKRFVDQTAIPMAIDAAGAVEAVIENVAEIVRRRPLTAVLAAALCGYVVAELGRASSRPRS